MGIRNDILQKILEAVQTGGSTEAQIQEAANKLVGWQRVADTQYTEASPFPIANGASLALPNNAGEIIDSQLPDGVTTFYDSATGKIVPENELDKMTFTIRFKAKNTAANGAYLQFGIDIGGTFGVIFEDSQLFVKGANTEQSFNFVAPGYTGATFLANGGEVKVSSVGGNSSIYDIEYQLERTKKAQ